MDTLKLQVNQQGMSGPLDLRPLAADVDANLTYYATDTGEYWICIYEDGFAPRWEQIGESSTGLIQIYANPTTGNDANPGTRTKPVRTFQKAQSLIPVSPRALIEVILAAGTYDEISGPDEEWTYTFGALASVNGTQAPGINIVGELVPFAGPFVLAAPSDPDGTTVQVSATPGVDDWEGLSFVITDCSDASLINTSRMIVGNDAVGNLRWLYAYGQEIPAGTTVYVASAGSILPASRDMTILNNAPEVAFGAVKLEMNTAAITVIQTGGSVFFTDGSEIDNTALLGINGLTGSGGSVSPFFLGERIDTAGNGTFFVDSFVGPRTALRQAHFSFDSAVLRATLVVTGTGGGVAAELTMLEDSPLINGDGGHLNATDCESKNMSVLAPFVLAAFGSTLHADSCVLNGWVAADGILIADGSSANLTNVSGDAAFGAPGYGIRLTNASTAILDTDTSITNLGNDIILEDPAGDVIVTYAGLAITTYAPPAAIPALCRVAL